MRQEPTVEEKIAYSIVKEMFPDIKFELKDKPDIQAIDKSIGIEVVNGLSSEAEKYLNTKRKTLEKQKSESPFLDARKFTFDLFISFETQYEAKLKKLNAGNYDGFQKYGLTIFSAFPVLNLNEEDWFRIPLEELTKKYKRHFDFIIVAPRCNYPLASVSSNHVWQIDVSPDCSMKTHQ